MGFSVLKIFTYSDMFDGLILRKWDFRRTYISTKSMLVENDLYIDFLKKHTDEQTLNFIEIIDNMLAVRPDYEYLKMRSIYIIDNNYKLMLETLRLLIENLGLEETGAKDGWITLIPKNEILDRVIEGLSSQVQWEIISYLKIKKDDLDSKRKQLAYLATELYIEKDDNENGYAPFNIIMNECNLLLNNLHIRHNNKTGKWENEVVKNINKKEALDFCDITYNKMLTIVLMRKDLEHQDKIKELAKNLKR